MADQQPPAAPTPEDRQAQARARAEALARTIDVFQRYDWGTDLVAIDPDDMLVDRPEVEGDEKHPPHPRLMKLDFERFIDEAYVGRVLGAAERILETETAPDLRSELTDALDLVEDLSVPGHVVGFHVAAMADAARRAKQARRSRDESVVATDEARTAVAALTAAGDDDRDDLAHAVADLGEAGWRALADASRASAERDASDDDAALAGLRVAAVAGGARAIRFAVETIADAPADSGLVSAAVGTLQGLGLEAGWATLARLHFEGLSTTARRALLEVALDTDESLAVSMVLHEAIEAFEGQIEGVGAEHGIDLTKLLLDRQDPRAVPLLAFVLKADALSKESHETIVSLLQESKAWGPVSEVLASMKGNWPLIVPAGVPFESFAARTAEAEGVDVKDRDALEAFMEKARSHWDRVYREELGYLRTRDADRAGPVEDRLMRQFSAEASHLVQGMPDQQRMQARIENFRESWMRTPLRTLDGRRPLVAILAERMELQPEGIGRERARRTILARTMGEAKAYLAAGRPKRARTAMAVLDDLCPGYAPAHRLRRSLEAAG